MNKAVTGLALGTIVIDLVAVGFGAYYAYKTKKQIESEIDSVKTETNKTVQKLGKVLSSFEV